MNRPLDELIVRLQAACQAHGIPVTEWPARAWEGPQPGTLAVKPLPLLGALRWWARAPDHAGHAQAFDLALLHAFRVVGLEVRGGHLHPVVSPTGPAEPVLPRVSIDAPTPAELALAHEGLRRALRQRQVEVVSFYGSGLDPHRGWVRVWVSHTHGCIHADPRLPYTAREDFLRLLRDALTEAQLVELPRLDGHTGHVRYVPTVAVLDVAALGQRAAA